MKIAGLTMSSVWAQRMLRRHGVETELVEGQPAEIGVFVEAVDFAHHGPEHKFRPYLHLTGELRSVRPAEPLPHGVTEVAFPPGKGDVVTAFYEFDDEQLESMAKKGYFSPAFRVPETFVGLEWELPVTIDSLVLAPQEQSSATHEPDSAEQNYPIVFVKVHELGAIETDLERSGYDLVEYFADVSTHREHSATAEMEEAASRARVRVDDINPIFDESEFVQQQPATVATQQPATTEPEHADDLESRIQQIDADLDAKAAELHREAEGTEGTAENIYRERVAQALTSDAEVDQTEQSQPTASAPAESTPEASDRQTEADSEVSQPLSRAEARRRFEEAKAAAVRRSEELFNGAQPEDEHQL